MIHLKVHMNRICPKLSLLEAELIGLGRHFVLPRFFSLEPARIRVLSISNHNFTHSAWNGNLCFSDSCFVEKLPLKPPLKFFCLPSVWKGFPLLSTGHVAYCALRPWILRHEVGIEAPKLWWWTHQLAVYWWQLVAVIGCTVRPTSSPAE